MTLDRQSRAFRDARPEDRVPDEELPDWAEVVHHPPADHGDLIAGIKLPHEWEWDNWDAGREGPKSLEEAQAALAARIDDPLAPDGPEVAGAYDDLGD